MGTNYKLGGEVKGALHGWRKRAKKKLGTIGEDFSEQDSSHGGNSHHAGSLHVPTPQVFSSSYCPSPQGSTPLHQMSRHGASDSLHHGGQFTDQGSHVSMIRVTPSNDVALQVRDDSGRTP